MKEDLISKAVFAKATQLERFQFAVDSLMKLTKIERLNQLYAKADKTTHLHFIESIFEQLDFSHLLDESQLNRIPKEGPFITVSNHPFGALDGLLLIYIISQIRPDYKVMANFLLNYIKPLESHFISVNPFEKKKELYSSIAGLKSGLSHLNQGNPLGIFPAGEVSSFQTTSKQIEDKKWNKSIIKFIKKANVPIIPIYFKGKNSLLFHLLGLIHPDLRTACIPREIFKKSHAQVQLRIGHPIDIETQKEWTDIDQFGRFLRAKTYSLNSSITVKSYFNRSRLRLKKVEPTNYPLSPTLLQKEIKQIEHLKLFEQADFEVYLAHAKDIPNCLKEIGRLREVTFRAVGEGTNRCEDLDEFDLYYSHLFLWDKEELKIAGAYRLGKGDEIYKAFGKKGFYIHSLFKIKDAFLPILKQSLEMGRSFVIKEYQQKRLPLFLLWKGIMHFLNANPNYRYLIGPVSISNSYTKLSRMLIVQFIKTFYFDAHIAQWIVPRKNFKVQFKKTGNEELISYSRADFKKADQIIADCEPNHMPIPVLVKQYLKKNAKIIGFHLDPKFNNALDGLIILDLKLLPENVRKEYSQTTVNVPKDHHSQ